MFLVSRFVLPDPVYAEGQGPDSEERLVDKETAKNLVLADEAIKYARAFVPEPGNQEFFIKKSDGMATFKQMSVQNLKGIEISDRTDLQNYFDSTTSKIGKISCFGGGACMEFSKLAEFFLAGRVTGTNIYRVSTTISKEMIGHITYNYWHDFVLVGDLKKAPRQAVLVDPWVVNPSPMLWVDSKWYTSRIEELEILKTHEQGSVRKHDVSEKEQRRYIRELSQLTIFPRQKDFSERDARKISRKVYDVKTAWENDSEKRYVTRGVDGIIYPVFLTFSHNGKRNPSRSSAISDLRKRRKRFIENMRKPIKKTSARIR